MSQPISHTLPTGSVTFLFTDIEGSTRLVEKLGGGYGAVLDAHNEILRSAIRDHGGTVVSTEGDSFFAVFADGSDAVGAAVAAQTGLAAHAWPDGVDVVVRMGIHSGEGTLGGDNYTGIDVHRAARIAAAGHGGQVVLSGETGEAVIDALPDGVQVRPLGIHRLRDLASPIELSDLRISGLPDEFPALRTVTTIGERVPMPLSSFVGREHDVAAIAQQLDTSRLVTLTGPGGIGKSRLALEVADRISSRFDAVFFVPLAPISDAGLVASTILRALDDPPSTEESEVRLATLLGNKRWLLILDNFEHVTDAAALVAKLLADSRGVAFLVTSRVPLGIAGESEYVVGPLATDTRPDSSHDTEAVTLFVDRALAVRPDLVLDDEAMGAIAEITDALDGIPLAIELAAARVRVIPPAALKQRMGSLLDLSSSTSAALEPRLQTLRDAIGWSYDLLTPSQQQLLEDVSVFRGGATLDAIEAVAGAGRSYWDWLADLDALVSHSLVFRIENPNTSRFGVYEVIREFASERLSQGERSQIVLARHFSWFSDLAERAAGALVTADQGLWLDTLDDDRGNLLAALRWSMASGDAAGAGAMAFFLWRFWHMRGPIREGAELVDEVLAMEALDAGDRIAVLDAAGGLAWWSGDMPGARTAYGEAVQLARTHGSDDELANALYNHGLALAFGEIPDDGLVLLNESLAIGERTGNGLIIASSLWGMASVHQVDHDFNESMGQLTTALALFREAGDE
ncbi:MAG: ATP-binding protein, partial [Acidimicrobiia bacterium]